MGILVAIGGGSIGQRGLPVQTLAIDREIIRRTGKTRPKLLFIPTASMDRGDYAHAISEHFGTRLGCRVDTLYLLRERPSASAIARHISRADLIYVGGGNTLNMMNVWRRRGVDHLLAAAYRNSTVLCGVSAGAICWFRYGNSNSRKKHPKDKALIRVSGLGFINALLCPHYDDEPHRQTSLKHMMRNTPGVSLAIEKCCALEIVNDTYRIIASKPGKVTYRIYWHLGQYHKEVLPATRRFAPLSLLLDPARSIAGASH